MPYRIPCISYKQIKKCEIGGVGAEIQVGTVIFLRAARDMPPRGFMLIDEKIHEKSDYPHLIDFLIREKKFKKADLKKDTFVLSEIFQFETENAE